jgi:hypothetical protein
MSLILHIGGDEMPLLPGLGDVHVDQLLTDMSIAVMNESTDFVFAEVFPRLNVGKQTNIIPKYDDFAWLSDEAQIRVPATESEGSGWTVDNTNKYLCENFAFHKDVPVEISANADAPYDDDEAAVEFTVSKIMLKQEIQFVADFMGTTIWGTDVDLNAGGKKPWNDKESLLAQDIEDGKSEVSGKIVRDPMKLVTNRKVWGAIKQHPDIFDRMRTTADKIPTLQQAANLLELDTILISRAIRATNQEGQTLAKERVMGDTALLLYVTSRPSLLRPSAGYTFVWNVLGAGFPVFTRRIPRPLAMAERIESHSYIDRVKTSADAGVFFDNAFV